MFPYMQMSSSLYCKNDNFLKQVLCVFFCEELGERPIHMPQKKADRRSRSLSGNIGDSRASINLLDPVPGPAQHQQVR